MTPIPLPIDPLLPELVAVLRSRTSLVLQAPTGAGKTTRVPPALLDAGLAKAGRIIVLEPRRLAARAAARRIAVERGSRLGEEIGYQVRFEHCCGPNTRLLVVTPGILLRLLQDDPFLETVGTIVFDEFHERSLESDLALGIARLLQQTVRDDLRLVAMSATLGVEAVARYLGDCPVVVSEGRSYPVEVSYQARPETCSWPLAVARAVAGVLDRTAGDLLVFLPGLQEIRHTAHQLEPLAKERDLAVQALHGDLPADQQDAALLPQGRRKVVLATNVAETSVTVEEITAVIDTGLARQLVFDPHVGLDRLQLTPISQAAAEQRRGRAGRTQPGICVRLWREAAQRWRPEQTEPEIRRVDLAGAVLHLLALGEANLTNFPWLDPPPAATVEQALALLERLGAATERRITDLGRLLARLPVPPRLGRLLVEGHRLGQLRRTATAAALLAERDPFTRSLHESAPDNARTPTSSDLLDRVDVLEEFESSGQCHSALGTLNRHSARMVLRAGDQLARSVSSAIRRSRPEPVLALSSDEAVMQALLAAFPDRLARRRAAGSRKGLMVGGRGVLLGRHSGVMQPELFLCLDVDAGGTESLVRLASAVQRDWLPAHQLTTAVDLFFDADSERVLALRRCRFADLVLEETQVALPEDGRVAQMLAEAARRQPEKVLPPADSPAGLFLTRVRCLAQWLPELQLPTFAGDELEEVLAWLCPGCRSFAELRQADWLQALQGKLTPQQRLAVEREAPPRLEVPSGSKLALRYEVGRPPVLAVRIQEMFGLHSTPRIAAGRVPVLLHLLGPNYRPQQITDDLASFWTNTYPQIRKELRARYPRHSWPEDPWTAAPSKRHRG